MMVMAYKGSSVVGSMLILSCLVQAHCGYDGMQPLSKLAMHQVSVKIDSKAWVKATPSLLGANGSEVEWVSVTFGRPSASASDWIGVFSPSNISSSSCPDGLGMYDFPMLCTAPIKYKYANYSTPEYMSKGQGWLTFLLINQRQDFAFALFTGDVYKPVLVAISNQVTFQNPKAPLYPRLAIGMTWNEMAVTWTSGYSQDEATALVKWGPEWQKEQYFSPAGSLTYGKEDMCGPPAKTIGWRDPGFTHTAFLKELWPKTKYYYTIGHKLQNGSFVWGNERHFVAAPSPGDGGLQQIVVIGDTGKAERDGSNEYENYQPGCLNTTDRLVEDLENIDIIFHVGDISYSNGYISQWDQFNEMFKQITARVPLMVASGNHERDYPYSGSFYQGEDSGGECGIPAQTNYYYPAKNPSKFWYSVDYGMLRFCVMNTELEWSEGSEQFTFIEGCLSSVDRQRQPWLIFIGHRVLSYSSNDWYGKEGSFEEPMGRESLQKLWQKYKVDIAFWGHVHSYERIYPTFQNTIVSNEKSFYSGFFNATIHLVVGGGGSHLSNFTSAPTLWSAYRDRDFGFTKLTAFNHSTLLLEYRKSSDGKVYDSFWIKRHPMDVLHCDSINYYCPGTTLAT